MKLVVVVETQAHGTFRIVHDTSDDYMKLKGEERDLYREISSVIKDGGAVTLGMVAYKWHTFPADVLKTSMITMEVIE